MYTSCDISNRYILMQNRWTRTGDFNYQFDQCHAVVFNNKEKDAVIKEISILKDSSDIIQVKIKPTVFYYQKILMLCSNIVKDVIRVHLPFIAFEIDVNKAVLTDQLINLMSELHKIYHGHDFDCMKDEISQIIQFSNNNKPLVKSSIPIDTTIYNISNDELKLIGLGRAAISAKNVNQLNSASNKLKKVYGKRTYDSELNINEDKALESKKNIYLSEQLHSCALVYYLICDKEPKINIVIDLLRKGEDPDQEEFCIGQYPLQIAIIRGCDINIIKALLHWKANPSDPHSSLNARQVAEFYRNKKALDVITAFTAPKKPPTEVVTVLNVKRKIHDHEIITTFEFSNGKTIESKLITSEMFINNNKVKKAVFEIVKTTFVYSNDKKFKKITKFFNEEFKSKDNKWVEVIYDKDINKIIGFNLFRFVDVEGKLVCKCEDSVILPNTFPRGHGINTLFFFRPALSVQCLMDLMVQHPIIIYYLATSFKSARLVEGDLSTLMFESEFMNAINKFLIDDEFRNKYVFIYKGRYIITDSLPSVSNSALINSTEILPKQSIEEESYNQFNLMCNKESKVSNRVAVISFFPDEGFFNRRNKRLEEFKVDFAKEIIWLAEALYKEKDIFLRFLPKIVPSPVIKLVHAPRFFYNVNSEEKKIKSANKGNPKLRSRL